MKKHKGREELIDCIVYVREKAATDPESIAYSMSLKDETVAHPRWPWLILDPPEELGENSTAEQLADYLLAYAEQEWGDDFEIRPWSS